jgi:protocatechuate 3,4-dioxygenase beta subunit
MTGRHVIAAVVLAAGLAGAVSAQPRCAPTPRDMEGPFYKPNAPVREATGTGLRVQGGVKAASTCNGITGARVEWWQANPSGAYDDAHRGTLLSGDAGAYRFDTDFPPPYSGRPSHIHFKASAPGFRPLTTQLYLKGGEREVTFDLVLVKE